MSDSLEFWDKRERYSQAAPDHYSDSVSKASIKSLFVGLGKKWKINRTLVKYVDLGCSDCMGTSLFTDFLEHTTGMPVKAVGIDASPKCEVRCKERNVDFMRLNLGTESIPLKDCQVFTLFETIEHVFDTDFLLESVRYSISRDGVLLVSTMNVVCWKNRIMVPLGIQPINTEVSTRKLSYGYRLGSLKRRVETWQPAGHIRPFTLYSLCDMLNDNNFTVINSYGLENWRPFKFLESIAKNMCTGILVIARPS